MSTLACREIEIRGSNKERISIAFQFVFITELICVHSVVVGHGRCSTVEYLLCDKLSHEAEVVEITPSGRVLKPLDLPLQTSSVTCKLTISF